jgi:hypothetical protein
VDISSLPLEGGDRLRLVLLDAEGVSGADILRFIAILSEGSMVLVLSPEGGVHVVEPADV